MVVAEGVAVAVAVLEPGGRMGRRVGNHPGSTSGGRGMGGLGLYAIKPEVHNSKNVLKIIQL